MKKITKIAVSTLLISLFLSSCTTKKQHCDAYGQLSTIETETTSTEADDIKISKSEETF